MLCDQPLLTAKTLMNAIHFEGYSHSHYFLEEEGKELFTEIPCNFTLYKVHEEAV